MIPPTVKMARCLEAIRRLTTPAGVPPSYSELAAALGYAGAPQICNLLRDMKARGLVDFEPGRARSLRIVAQGPGREDLARLGDEDLRRVASWCLALLAERSGAAG